MNTSLLEQKVDEYYKIARQHLRQIGSSYQTFRSETLEKTFPVNHTGFITLFPILKVKDILLKHSVFTYLDGHREEYFKDRMALLEDKDNQGMAHVFNVVQIYTDLFQQADAELTALGYTELTKENESIVTIFKDSVGKGTNTTLDVGEIDKLCIKLYTNNEDTIVVVANYALAKKLQNKYGMLPSGNRPTDLNFMITVGLMPAFIPKFKELLTDEEKEIFKLFTTPVKLFHEKEPATLYYELITSEYYLNTIKEHKTRRLKQLLQDQEERIFEKNIVNARRRLDEVLSVVQDAEQQLLEAQKEQLFYQAGERSLSDAVTYLSDHPYLKDINPVGSLVYFKFRVPLTQWDPELATTVLKGLKENPDRYNISVGCLEDVKQFFKHILIDQSAVYWIYAEFFMSLDNFRWDNVKVYWNGSTSSFNAEKLTALQAGVNPHLEYHNCVGTYERAIRSAQHNRDLVGLVENILAPFKNWNLADGVVFGHMTRHAIPNLIKHNIKCVEYQGEMLTLTELNQRIEGGADED